MELAVAPSVSGVPTVWAAIVPKLMVCGSPLTVKLCEAVAGAYVLLPACEAVMLQVPAATNVAVFPETVQTPVVEEA